VSPNTYALDATRAISRPDVDLCRRLTDSLPAPLTKTLLLTIGADTTVR